MEIWLWAAALILAAVSVLLLVKIYLLRKGAREIRCSLKERMAGDEAGETNTLIDLSTRDGEMRRLARELNGQLMELRRLRHRFRQGDRELKGAVANISHDLRTPLTSISGYLELLEQGEHSPEDCRYLAVIRERVELMGQLTEELFRYSVFWAEDSELSPESISLNRALEESVAAFYGALTGRNIEPVIELPREKVIRQLDPAALSRILSNLLSNAVRYSDGDLHIRLTPEGEITFSNSAPGLNHLQVERLFDRFYTVEAARKSTGLGLSIARSLAERMGGSLRAEYREGRLCLRLWFPEKKTDLFVTVRPKG